MLKKLLTIIFMLSLLTVPLYAEGSKFAPLSEEFLQWRNDPNKTGERPYPVDRSYLSKNSKKVLRSSLKDGAITLPVSYDLRNFGRVTEIKNQGIYETCWAFASLGSIESNYLTQNLSFLETSPDLSELHMSWFTYADSNAENNYFVAPIDTGGIKIPEEYYVLGQGGNYYMAMAYLTRMSGPVDESLLPYENAPSMDVMPKTATDYQPLLIRVHESDFIGPLNPSWDSETRENVKNIIKEHIITKGAVQASYYSSGQYSNASGFTTYFTNNGTRTGHAIQIIGWDDNFSPSNFNDNDPDLIPSSKGAWIVKNSWDSNWGDEGYFYMSYEQYLARVASYVIKENETGIKHYGHDALGWCGDMQGKWQANVFKSERSNEIIKEIGFYTTSNNVSCDFYVFDLGTALPSNPLPSDISTPLFVSKDIEINNAGYHTLIPEKAVPIEEGHYFSIIAKINSQYAYPTAIEREREEYCYPAVYEGESWISESESDTLTASMEWTDGKNFFDKEISEDVPLNVCLKVFTVPAMTIDEEKFPDENFRTYILNTLDLDKDEYLSESEIAKATVINLNGLGIKDLTGIEIFTALKTLDCSENKLESLDLTGYENLSELICNSQDIDLQVKASRTFSTVNYTYKIDCSNLLSNTEKISDVTAEDIESYFDKENLIAYFNDLPTKIIYWYDTNFSDVLMSVYVNVSEEIEPVTPSEVSVEDAIESLRYEVEDETNLESYIDAMKGYVIEEVTAFKIPTYITNISGIEKFTGLQSVDLNANSAMTELNIVGSRIEYVTVRGCYELEEIIMKNCEYLLSLDVTNNPKLISIDVGNNAKLVLIDVENCVNLEKLSFPFCSVRYVNIEGCEALKIFEGNNNSLTELNFEGFENLSRLICNSQDIDLQVKASRNFSTVNYTYKIDCSNLLSNTEKISDVTAEDIESYFDKENLIAYFNDLPTKIIYWYDTNFSDVLMSVYVNVAEEIEPVNPSEVPVEDVIEALSSEVEDGTNLASYIDAMKGYVIEEVTAFKIPTYITNISGIEKFTGLQSLDLNMNSSITALNLSGSKIEYVEASICDELQEINLKGCESLTSLDAGGNTKLVSIDVENCVNLETLSFPFCSVNNVNILGCEALKILECENNSLAELNLESFDKLVEVSCSSQDVKGWEFGTEINFADFVSHPEKISNIKAFDKDDKEISVSSTFFAADTDAKATFASIPAKISYDYETGFEADENLKMDVTVTNSKIDEGNKNISGSSGGSCSTGINIFSAAVILLALIKRK